MGGGGGPGQLLGAVQYVAACRRVGPALAECVEGRLDGGGRRLAVADEDEAVRRVQHDAAAVRLGHTTALRRRRWRRLGDGRTGSGSRSSAAGVRSTSSCCCCGQLTRCVQHMPVQQPQLEWGHVEGGLVPQLHGDHAVLVHRAVDAGGRGQECSVVVMLVRHHVIRMPAAPRPCRLHTGGGG